MSVIVNASRNNSSTSLQRQEPDRQSALRLNLNGNRLVFVNGSKWVVETSDLDVAANEMDKILDEREELETSLEEARAHIDALNKEIIETNEMKNAALGMVGQLLMSCYSYICSGLTDCLDNGPVADGRKAKEFSFGD